MDFFLYLSAEKESNVFFLNEQTEVCYLIFFYFLGPNPQSN